MFGNTLVSGRYARGTLCAGVGLIIIAVYYVRAWHELRGRSESSLPAGTSVSPESQFGPELRYLQWGMLASVLFFMLAGAADAASDWLDRLVGCLMGFCAAIGIGMFGVGFVCLANLWKELVLQLKNAKISSLLLSIPLAVIGLALGLGVFVALGMFLTKLSDIPDPAAAVGHNCRNVLQPLEGTNPCRSDVATDSDGLFFCHHHYCCRFCFFVDILPNRAAAGHLPKRHRNSQCHVLFSVGSFRSPEE